MTRRPAKDDLDVCLQCDRKFPDALLSPLCVNGDYFLMCPICALEMINEVHGTKRKKFQGEQAQFMLERAQHFLKTGKDLL